MVGAGVMPPWHADPRYGRFENDRRLPEVARRTILDWLVAGMPPGDPLVDPEPAASDESADGWRIGKPDVIIELPAEVTVPATGDLPYHAYRVAAPFAEDVWVQAAEARPGNPRVVHHIIVESFLEGARSGPGDDDARTVGSLGGYVPGDQPLVFPAGLGRRIPAGATIAFQMHYTPTGEVETDRSRLGLVLAREPPERESRTGLVSTPFLWIPAGSNSVTAEASFTFARDSMLLSLRPHLHLRGRSFEYRARYPDGGEEILLLVEPWDFDWQTTYVLAEPKPMPAGTRLLGRATWDNSASNPRNPDSSRDISWGEQTTDEMMIGFFDYYEGPPRSPE